MITMAEAVVERLPIAVYAIAENRFVYVNAKFAETLGYAREEILRIADAIFETVFAFSVPAASGRGWYLFSGVSSFVLGLMIVAQWPNSSTWAIGTLFGVAFILRGQR